MITGIVIIFILVNAIKTDCFQTSDWVLTAVALLFAIFVRTVASVSK